MLVGLGPDQGYPLWCGVKGLEGEGRGRREGWREEWREEGRRREGEMRVNSRDEGG